MYDEETLLPIPPTGLDYEEYAKEYDTMRDIIYRDFVSVQLCEEMYAGLYYRSIIKDKKLFTKRDNYYKPDKMAIISSPIKSEYLGVYHSESDDINKHYLEPLDSLELIAGLDAFVANNLNVHKTYKCFAFSFHITQKADESVLCVDLGHNFKKSYLDKYHCRNMSLILKDILHTSDYRY